ncbi:MAG: hypothetical protein ACE5K4_00320 [Candidatus Hydrothermarchaeota archaeon]
MKKTLAITVLTYLISILFIWALYYQKPRPVDWHHLFAYLSLVGFSVLSISGFSLLISNERIIRRIHVSFALTTMITIISTFLTHKYALIY